MLFATLDATTHHPCSRSTTRHCRHLHHRRHPRPHPPASKCNPWERAIAALPLVRTPIGGTIRDRRALPTYSSCSSTHRRDASVGAWTCSTASALASRTTCKVRTRPRGLRSTSGAMRTPALRSCARTRPRTRSMTQPASLSSARLHRRPRVFS